MPRVFISYRRDDTRDVAGRLRADLEDVLGRDQVFMDVSSLAGGDDFLAAIGAEVARADAVIALIGPSWVDIVDETGAARIHRPDDVVRHEIVAALQAGTRVVPVLVGDARPLAAAELPEDLSALPTLHALPLRPDPDFSRDVQDILSAVGYRSRRRGWAIGAMAILAVSGAVGLQSIRSPSDAAVEEVPSELTAVAGVPVVPYDPAFLGGGHQIPLPDLTGRARDDAYEDGMVVDYLHYSLVINEQRSLATYVGVNVDRDAWLDIDRDGREEWLSDDRLPIALQRGDHLYTQNDLDRGHLVSRHYVNWADSSVVDHDVFRRAAFFFQATAPMHADFNRHLWSRLERYVFRDWQPEARRIVVFVGPVFRDSDPRYRLTGIPQSYWTVAIAVHPENPEALVVQAFLGHQFQQEEDGTVAVGPDELPVSLGRQPFDPRELSVPLSELAQVLHLDFRFLEQYDVTPP